MTLLKGTFKDSLGRPLVGYIRILIDYLVTDPTDNISYTPVAAIAPLDIDGNVSVTLEPSEISKVTYLFELFQKIGANPDPALDTPVWSFRAKVPDSLEDVIFADLITGTGITHDALDGSLLAITRRLYNSDGFWSRLLQEVFRHTGAYSDTRRYKLGQIVEFQGSSYLYASSEPSFGIKPPTQPQWGLLGSIGATGAGTSGNISLYDSQGWLDAPDAPSRGAVRNVIETLATKEALSLKAPLIEPVLSLARSNTSPILTDRSSQLVTSEWVQEQLDTIRYYSLRIGSMIEWPGVTAPAGWIICDGRTLNRITYAALFAEIGTTYKLPADIDNTLFRVPDKRGRTSIGLNVSLGNGNSGRIAAPWGSQLGGTGGNETTTLDPSQLPTFNLAIPMRTTLLEGVSGMGAVASTTLQNRLIVSSPDSTVTSSIGLGAAHNNMQPTIALNSIIFAGI